MVRTALRVLFAAMTLMRSTVIFQRFCGFGPSAALAARNADATRSHQAPGAAHDRGTEQRAC
jgi:hypothetical protein